MVRRPVRDGGNPVLDGSKACRSGLNCSGREPEGSGLHSPASPGMDFPERASSNFVSNIVSETGSTDFVDCLLKLQAEAAGDDFFLDLGVAAEDGLVAAIGPGAGYWVFAHVAVAAVELDAAVGDSVAELGVPPLDH
jgi:hypothetical protein